MNHRFLTSLGVTALAIGLAVVCSRRYLLPLKLKRLPAPAAKAGRGETMDGEDTRRRAGPARLLDEQQLHAAGAAEWRNERVLHARGIEGGRKEGRRTRRRANARREPLRTCTTTSLSSVWIEARPGSPITANVA